MPAFVAVLVLVGACILVAVPAVGRQTTAIGTRLLEPVEFGVSHMSFAAVHLFDTVHQAAGLAQQNEAYSAEIDRLQSQLVQLREMEQENEDLRQMLGLRARAPIGSMLSVNVIARDSVSILQAVSIDRGSNDGVAVNDAVITWRGIVGRIEDVHPDSANVLLATDVNSAVDARIQAEDSRATGVVHGTGDGRLAMEYVPVADSLSSGDLVITSGTGGTFPAGLVVGQVLQVRRKDSDVFQEALVQPAVDMRDLERLYVLIDPVDTTSTSASQ